MRKKMRKHFKCIMTLLLMGVGSYSAFAQDNSVTGTVIASDGMPVPGVNIVQKGTNNGVVTDFDGNYTIPLKEGQKTLVFSSMGYKAVEKAVGTNKTINITLEEDTEALDEVVVVGYGTQKKENLTGAIGMAKGDVLEDRPIATVGQGLQGVIPGLNITVPSGDPSASVDFNIRGFESINGGSPLILVDNVPMDINQLNPNDIESITVLKDAAASAIYGARAAFGVVLVKTKKGKKGKVTVSLSTEASMAHPIFYIDPVEDPYKFVTNWNLASTNAGGNPVYDDNYLEGTKRWSENPTDANLWGVYDDELRYYGFNDYQSQIVNKSTPQQKYNVSISGTSDKSSYYVSLGFLDKKGYLANSEKNQDFQRYNVLMNVDFTINDWLSLSEKMVYSSQSSNEPANYGFDAGLNSVTRVTPIDALSFPDLDYYLTPGDRDEYQQYIGMGFVPSNTFNSLPYIEEGGRNTWRKHDLWLTQGLTLSPFEGMRIKSDFSYNVGFRDEQNAASKIIGLGNYDLTNLILSNGGSANDYIRNQTNYNEYYAFNAYAEYTYDKNPDHYVKGMIGYNQEWGNTKRIVAQANTLISPGITDLNATTGDQSVQGGRQHYALRGAFFRVNYNYKERYLLEINGRYDGTSRFPQADRFGFFPSFSAAWRISNESFMESTRGWLDNLKLRGSYGELGNQILVNDNGGQLYYPYVPALASTSSDFILSEGQTPIVKAPGLVSPTLTWESVNTTNFGLDITMFKGRFDLSADIYSRKTMNMLLEVSKPAILGADPPKENGADLETKGWELSVGWRDKIGQNWSYGLNINLADSQSKITKYDNPTGRFNDYYVGKNIGEIWGLETAGIFQTDAEVANAPDQSAINSGGWVAGDMQYADLNNDGIIDRGNSTLDDRGDQRVIGNTTPRYTFGITPNIKYKNFSLNLFFQGLFRDYLPPITPWGAFYPYNTGYMDKYYLTETWSPGNPDAYFARPMIATSNSKNIQPQSRYVQDASYIRLKNVTLNYTFSQDLISRFGLSNLQIYLSGQNLWEATKIHKPLDPEDLGGLSQQYYFERVGSLGLKVAF